MENDESTVADHLKYHHPDLHFEEFQCINCAEGFNDIGEIRDHMSQMHASNFLFIGARRRTTPDDDPDEVQIVYIGESRDYSQYTFSEWSDGNALNGLDPTVLDPEKLYESLQVLNFQNKHLKVACTTDIPPITFVHKVPGSTDFFIKYDQYLELPIRQNKKPVLVEYRCITKDMAAESSAIEPYLAQLAGTDKCEGFRMLKQMIDHRRRRHLKQPIVYLQTERSDFLVYKIVRCSFKCQMCTDDILFETRAELSSHFFQNHRDHFVGAQIVQVHEVIQSNDPRQPVHSKTESAEFFYSSLLVCFQHEQPKTIGVKCDAISHYSTEHDTRDQMELKLGEFILENTPEEIVRYTNGNGGIHRSHLFECLHCSKLFESMAHIQSHFDEMRAENADTVLRFRLNKLFACPYDKVIRTFKGMQCHYGRKHPNKAFVVTNALYTLGCGLCMDEPAFRSTDEIITHQKREHPNGEQLTDDLLKSLHLDNIEVFQCKFSPGCCDELERNLILQVVKHIMECSRRFVCLDCQDLTFNSAISFATHCNGEHGKKWDEIKHDLYNIKGFLALLSDMHIILPNGLVVMMNEISNTRFGADLRLKINALVTTLWDEEKRSLHSFSLLAI